jgi:glycosyltransferase involved in cell wall biosynthesis
VTRRRIALVLSGFPRRSETFALAEVTELDDRGLLAAVFSTKPGEPGEPQPAARRLQSRVQMLSGNADAQAAEAAWHLDGTPIAGVHAYFAHTPAEVGSALARSLGVPFGFSMHARDARKIAREQLHHQARHAACVVACNADVAHELDGSGAAVQIVPHGVDLDRFRPRPSSAAPIFRLLAVGRLVEKKGFDVMLDALATVPVAWRLRLVGDGPERERLTEQARKLGIADWVSFLGAMTHDAVPSEYSQADALVVPSVLDRSGDRDGLPNVVLEAMASGVAIVATDIGAIPSAIRDGDTGLLVPARDRVALAAALAHLGRDPDLRRSLGNSARESAERRFDGRRCARRLVSVIREAYV